MKRLALVVALATGGFAVAIVRFSAADTTQSCVVDAPADASYSARWDGAVTMDGTNHTLEIARTGQPITGATVCLETWMPGMSGMAMTTGASELSAGRYNVPFQFQMGGPWQATVLVTPKGGTEAATTVKFDVGAGAAPAAPSPTPAPSPSPATPTATPGG